MSLFATSTSTTIALAGFMVCLRYRASDSMAWICYTEFHSKLSAFVLLSKRSIAIVPSVKYTASRIRASLSVAEGIWCNCPTLEECLSMSSPMDYSELLQSGRNLNLHRVCLPPSEAKAFYNGLPIRWRYHQKSDPMWCSVECQNSSGPFTMHVDTGLENWQSPEAIS